MASAKELAEALHKALNAHDVAKLGEHLAENVTYWEPNLPQPIRGRAAVQQHFKGNWASFPDSTIRIVSRIESGNTVVDEMEWTGTHKGPIQMPGQPAIPPTGKRAKGMAVGVLKTDKGKITDMKVYYDNLQFLAQLGLMTPPGSK